MESAARTMMLAVLLGAASVAHVSAQTNGGGKWQVEIRGGAAAFTNPSSGTTALPAPVVDATLPDGRQVRRVQSWYFGAGPVYLQQGRPPVLMPPMVPLDPVLTSALVTRPAGGAVGVRVGRAIGSRLAVDVTSEYGLSALEMPGETIDAIERSRAAFVTTWNAFMRSPPGASFQATSASTVTEQGGRQLATTAALTYTAWSRGRLSLHVTGGGGVVSYFGDAAGGSLQGTYRVEFIDLGALQIQQTDAVTFRSSIPRHVPAAVGGGGLTWHLGSRGGLRVEIRDLIAPNRLRTVVTAAPTNLTTPPPSLVITISTPQAMPVVLSSFSQIRPTLSESVTDFETYKGRGVRHTVQTTVGWYWRF